MHIELRDGTPWHRCKPDTRANEIAETMAKGARVCIVWSPKPSAMEADQEQWTLNQVRDWLESIRHG